MIIIERIRIEFNSLQSRKGKLNCAGKDPLRSSSTSLKSDSVSLVDNQNSDVGFAHLRYTPGMLRKGRLGGGKMLTEYKRT